MLVAIPEIHDVRSLQIPAPPNPGQEHDSAVSQSLKGFESYHHDHETQKDAERWASIFLPVNQQVELACRYDPINITNSVDKNIQTYI